MRPPHPNFSKELPAGLAPSAAATTARPASTTATAAATRPAATAAAESAASAAAAEPAVGLGTSFVDIERAAVQRVPVESLNRPIRLSFVFHFHKREST